MTGYHAMQENVTRRRFAEMMAVGALGLGMAGCAQTEQDAGEAAAKDAVVSDAGAEGDPVESLDGLEPLLPAAPNPEDPFGVDLNINMVTIDQFLGRPDTVYRDMRLIKDPAAYEDIGGNADLSMTIEGFRITPYPYLGTLQELPVGGAYEGPSLFAISWGDDGRILDAKPRYTQSMRTVEELFPKDKNIVLMCGGAGYAAMMRALLLYLGWDADRVYNAGGAWYYGGDHPVQLISYADEDRPEYYLWRADVATIDFDYYQPLETDESKRN